MVAVAGSEVQILQRPPAFSVTQLSLSAPADGDKCPDGAPVAASTCFRVIQIDDLAA